MSEKKEKETFTMVLPEDAPCGCENGKLFGECHLKDGMLLAPDKSVNPPPPFTYEPQKKCHFAYTNNCAGGLTHEHILSKAVLKQISEKVITIHKDGTSRDVAINSQTLTVKRLCLRHNRAFHPVDAEAGRVMRAVKTAEVALGSGQPIQQPIYFFHRFDIERWLLKTLMNIYYSSGGLTVNSTSLPLRLVDAFSRPLRPPYGLYFAFRETGDGRKKINIANQASYHLIMEGTTVIGVSVTLAGIEFKLVVAGNLPYLIPFQSEHVYRPKTINLFQESKVVNLLFVGLEGTELDVWMSRLDPEGKVPTGIGGITADYLTKEAHN